MDNQEAIKMLTAKVECIRRETSGTNINCNSHNCDNCELCYVQGTTKEQLEALNKAISALEKQIPKKPVMTKTSFYQTLWWLDCPSCGNYVGMWNSKLGRDDMYNNSNKKICPYCGQAIDWEDE